MFSKHEEHFCVFCNNYWVFKAPFTFSVPAPRFVLNTPCIYQNTRQPLISYSYYITSQSRPAAPASVFQKRLFYKYLASPSYFLNIPFLLIQTATTIINTMTKAKLAGGADTTGAPEVTPGVPGISVGVEVTSRVACV